MYKFLYVYTNGCNITSPFKESVIQYLDDVFDNDTGSINCIFKNGERLCGFNSDYCGIKSIVDNNVEDRFNKNILIVGLGGAGKTATHCLKHNNLTIINRDYSKSVLLQSELIGYNIKLEKFENLEFAIKNNDVIINTLLRNTKNIFNNTFF